MKGKRRLLTSTLSLLLLVGCGKPAPEVPVSIWNKDTLVQNLIDVPAAEEHVVLKEGGETTFNDIPALAEDSIYDKTHISQGFLMTKSKAGAVGLFSLKLQKHIIEPHLQPAGIAMKRTYTMPYYRIGVFYMSYEDKITIIDELGNVFYNDVTGSGIVISFGLSHDINNTVYQAVTIFGTLKYYSYDKDYVLSVTTELPKPETGGTNIGDSLNDVDRIPLDEYGLEGYTAVPNEVTRKVHILDPYGKQVNLIDVYDAPNYRTALIGRKYFVQEKYKAPAEVDNHDFYMINSAEEYDKFYLSTFSIDLITGERVTIDSDYYITAINRFLYGMTP